MVDVQCPRSSLPPPLLDAQSSFSAFTSDPQYWSSEHSNSKRRNISQDLHSISYVGAYRSSPPPAARTAIKETRHGIAAPGGLVLPLRDMNPNNSTAHHQTQYNGYIPAISALAPQTQHAASEPQSRASSRPPSGRHISAENTPTGAKHVVENPVFLLPEDASGKGSNNGIVSYLQLPTSITKSKGSLAEFAAQVSFRRITAPAASTNTGRLRVSSGLRQALPWPISKVDLHHHNLFRNCSTKHILRLVS